MPAADTLNHTHATYTVGTDEALDARATALVELAREQHEY
jgi:hypothetical protein